MGWGGGALRRDRQRCSSGGWKVLERMPVRAARQGSVFEATELLEQRFKW